MMQPRPPIVVILGHVDHGKTSLLDYLRKSNIAAREAGGITQHIRSFQVTSQTNQPITFIDTPGHAAFSAMRKRGSHLADVAILIVAGNDGVMPQTKESIDFIRSVNVPFIVAITKSDLSVFDADRVKTQLTESEVIVEDFGGTVPVVSVSAKTGAGIPDLLELLQLVTSLNPPDADSQGQLEAVVLESRLDPHKGPVAVVIVKNGTLRISQGLFMDKPVGKVRSLLDSEGHSITTAIPSTPVEVLGLSLVPPVGEILSDKIISQVPSTASAPITRNDTAKVNIILKTDVAGSLEALLSSLDKEVNVVSSGTGDVTENDVAQARASSAYIVGFNVRIPNSVDKLAEVEKVPLLKFNIIYELLDSLNALVHPKVTEIILGKAEVLAEFKINSDRVAGCKVLEGQVAKIDKVRLIRGELVLGETKLKSLKQSKVDVPVVKINTEFGAVFSPYIDFKPGDYIIAFANHGPA